MMKLLLMICVLMSVNCAEARPRFHHRRLPKPMPYRLSWKQIAAGGVAAGTVIAAYKVGNGLENGMEKAAEKEPAGFLNIWTLLPHLLVLGGIFALCKWIQNLKPKGKRNEHQP